VADYFALWNGYNLSLRDLDLGAGGAILLPEMTDAGGQPVNLYVGAGKNGDVHLVDQSHLGGFDPSQGKNLIYQDLPGLLATQIRSTPAYFNNHVYFGPRDAGIQSFAFSQGKMAAAASSTTTTHFNYPGTSPSISANGTAAGILWAHENNGGAKLHAFNASNLTELYNSTQAAGGRDTIPGNSATKFTVPVVTGGKVFVGAGTGVAIFGLLP
jgi:hypothetical protein